MKKILFILAAFVALSASAQNPEAIQKKIDKNSEAIANPKKAGQASVWIERAQLFYELSESYTSMLLPGFTLATAEKMIGKPTSTEKVTLPGGAEYIKYEYSDFTVYAEGTKGIFQFWIANKGDQIGELSSACDNLEKAKGVNAKDFKSKGDNLCAKISETASNTGRSYYGLGEPKQAYEFFKISSRASDLRGIFDTMNVYYSGIAAVEAKLWKEGKPIFEKLETVNFSGDGNVCIYKSMCLENLGDVDQAITALETGFNDNPTNSNILSALINIYIKKEIDPKKLIDIVRKAESLDPKNASLYLVEGSVWDKLGDFENAEVAFQKSLSIDGKSFHTYYNIGLICIKRGEDIAIQRDKLDINDNKGYNKLSTEAEESFTKSIGYLEKAHELDKTDGNTIKLLKILYFQRMDTSAEYAKRHEYFDELSKSIAE